MSRVIVSAYDFAKAPVSDKFGRQLSSCSVCRVKPPGWVGLDVAVRALSSLMPLPRFRSVSGREDCGSLLRADGRLLPPLPLLL